MKFNKQHFEFLIQQAKGNMSISQFENKCNIGSGYIYKILKGKSNLPSPEVLRKISNCSNITYEDLMVSCGYINNIYELPNDLTSFILAKENLKYIKFAKKLKDNSIDPDFLAITKIIINKNFN